MPSPSPDSAIPAVVTPDGVHLHHHTVGEGPSVLVVPSASWLGADIVALAEHRTLVTYDLRGRGRSSAIHDESRLGLEKDVADLEFLCDALGHERISLLGWSYHAAVTAHFALAHPERVERMVFVGPAAPRARPYFADFLATFAKRVDLEHLARLEQWRREGLKERNPKAWGQAVHDIFFRAYVADPGCLERMQSTPCVEPNLDADRVNDQGRRVIEKLGNYVWDEDFAALDVPILILHGREDPVVLAGSEQWARILPAARLRVLEGVGHMPWLEGPAEFFPLVEDFLDGA